jgi:hypothetical protein
MLFMILFFLVLMPGGLLILAFALLIRYHKKRNAARGTFESTGDSDSKVPSN